MPNLSYFTNEQTAISTVPKTVNGCCHYWLIESPNGSQSRGVCKFCNEEREFDNLLYHYSPKGNRRGDRNVFERAPRQIIGIHRFPLV
ncbi:MAG: hypothetical protein PHR56_05830 [Dehalococcoidales bacterium]|nr:hypothetical protein [Dehalococcoidales bacterium]